MAKPPEGFWHVRDATLAIAAADTVITEGTLGVKPDGVFGHHIFSFELTDSGGTATATLYGAIAERSNAFVWAQISNTGALSSGSSYIVDPEREGVFKAYKVSVTNTTTDSTSFIHVRSSSTSI